MKISDIEVALVHHIGDDLDVANAARVSFDKQSEWEYVNATAVDEQYRPIPAHSDKQLSAKDVKLINYLAKHKHHSPFNHSFLSFRIKAPIFVARQLVKHKFMPWNEVSRRYVDSEPEFYYPTAWRKKAENVKQGSSEDKVELRFNNLIDAEGDDLLITPYEHCQDGLQMYKDLLSQGVCPEQARMVLPQNMMTEWRWSGTLGAFLDMLVLRLDPHTQKETRDVAELIAVEVKKLFPVSYTAYLGE